jgi:CheY-like chemotaxis protein
LQQVIMNLIINAAEAIGERAGQVTVCTGLCTLTDAEAVSWQIGEEPLRAGNYVLLMVQDNGQGMSAETLARIFDPFFTTKFTGRGLGLAAVQGIVRGHHGGLKVASTPLLGTTFELVFPIETHEAEEVETSEVLQEVDMTQQLVLVIDDEEHIREAVTDILDLEGITVLAAADGRSGLELYQQRRDEIGLIVLDLSMPGLSGEQTLQELRTIDAQVRVLLSSGFSQVEVTPRFAGQPNVGFIQKPYDAEQLVYEVKRHLMLAAED